jgi:hypothetical protein
MTQLTEVGQILYTSIYKEFYALVDITHLNLKFFELFILCGFFLICMSTNFSMFWVGFSI